MENLIRSFSVSKYLTAVRNVVDSHVKDTWVHGVITQIKEQGKMVYLSIAEFVEGDVKPVSTLPLYIFISDYAKIKAKLNSLPAPFELKNDLKVKFYIKGDFYVPYGKFQGRVLDIDPTYTVGELSLTKEAILKRLREEGLLFKNKSLALSEVPLNIGLITGENSAAFFDFTSKLKESHFAFKVTPVFARMQGSETENTILAALGTLRQIPNLDVVCIVRGGGSKTDLNYFDSEALCRAVANFPIPVFTGIGHEIDKCLLDQVAWQNCITPTDCAKYLIECLTKAFQKVKDLAMEIAARIHARIPAEQELLRRTRESLERTTNRILIQTQEDLEQIFRTLKKEPFKILQNNEDILKRYHEGLKRGSQKILDFAEKHFELEETRLKAADPKTILKKGYSLTFSAKGTILKDLTQIKIGDSITTQFANGKIESTVSKTISE